MDWKAERRKDMLNRVVAWLLALADLAESAAGRSRPVRWLAMWFLWQADTVARDFVAGAPHAAGRQWWSAKVRFGHDPDDAMKLAASFRSLARIVRNIAACLWRLSLTHHDHASVASDQGRRPLHGVVQTLLAFQPLDRLDTS